MEEVEGVWWCGRRASDAVVAVLFSQLLALESIAEYKGLHGKDIQMGHCNPGTAGDDIGVDKIMLRLFSIVHGDMVRADEKKGKLIDRTPGNGWIRFKGSKEWVNFM